MSEPIFRLGTFASSGGRSFAGIVLGDAESPLHVIDIAIAARLLLQGQQAEALTSARQLDDCLVEWDRSFDALSQLSALIRSNGWTQTRGLSTALDELVALPPVMRPGKIVCHAQNYADHVAEMRRSRFGQAQAPVDMSSDFMGEKAKTWPYAFLKASSAMVGANDNVVLPTGHQQIDWEAEMAVVMGRRGKRISEAQAMDHVAGFAVINDVSSRDKQWRSDRPSLRSDWFAAKSLDSFAPVGPFMVPRQFVANHMDLAIKLSVNGRLMQDGNTGGLIFGPEEQISFFSKSMTWLPGDLLATGTPGGTGQGLGIFLKAGDVIETSIAGLGQQRNVCVDEDADDAEA